MLVWASARARACLMIVCFDDDDDSVNTWPPISTNFTRHTYTRRKAVSATHKQMNEERESEKSFGLVENRNI